VYQINYITILSNGKGGKEHANHHEILVLVQNLSFKKY